MCFMVRPMTHFELISVQGVMSVSRFIVLHVDAQLSQHHLLKRLSVLHCIAFALLLNIS